MLIYKITNKVNNKCYIGSTNNFERRKYEHIISSTSQNYPSYNYPLQKAFRKYGIDNFIFEVVEDNIELKNIAKKEYDYIIKYNCLSCNGLGYNQTLYTDCALRDPDYIKKYIEQYGSKCAIVSTNNEIIKLFNSLHDLARYLNISGQESTIKAVCDGKEFGYHDLIFRYIIDNKVIIPEQLTRPRRKKICGISIYNKQDIVYYSSVSEAARAENALRTSISKCIAGNPRYTHVHNRIWREYANNEIKQNSINIDNIILKYSGYCIINYNTQQIYYGKSLLELSKNSGIAWATIQRNMKILRRVKNIGYYKLDINGMPIIEEVV